MSSGIQVQAVVNAHDFACHARRHRNEKMREGGNFVGLQQSRQRLSFEIVRLNRCDTVIVEHTTGQAALDIGGRDRVDSDVRSEGAREGESQCVHRAFRCRVGDRRTEAGGAGNRGEIDDCAAPARTERGRARANHLERTDQIDVVGACELAGRQRIEIRVRHEARRTGAVDQCIEPTEVREKLMNRRHAIGIIGYIEIEADRTRAVRLAVGNHGIGLSAIVRVERSERDIPTMACKGTGALRTDAGGRSGDEANRSCCGIHARECTTCRGVSPETRSADVGTTCGYVLPRELTTMQSHSRPTSVWRGAWTALLGLALVVSVDVAHPLSLSAQSPPLWEVYAIRYATVPQFKVAGLIAGADTSRRLDIAMTVWLLKSPSGRTVLLDAGFKRADLIARWKPTSYLRPDSAVSRAGVSVGDISDVIVSHIHWDHFDGVDLFPRAKIWIQREEVEHHIDATGNVLDRAIDAPDAAMLTALRAAGRVELVSGDAREIIPGVTVYTGGKHTFQSQYIAVRTAQGVVVLASDNMYLYENLEKHLPIAQTLDAASNLAAQSRMVSLAASPRLIVPGHDPAVFERFESVAPGVVRIR